MPMQASIFLHRALLLDAVATGATGILMAAGAGFLAEFLVLPQPLLLYAGLALLPFVAFVVYLARQPSPSRAAVWAVIAINVAWTADSILLIVGGWISPNLLGEIFVIGQALVVGLFAWLQYRGLRRSRTVAA